eukprot:UN07914
MNAISFDSLPAQMPDINQMNEMMGKKPMQLLNVCYAYAVVIGIDRIILFDNFNNVQGFMINGSVISVDAAGPELTAFILEPLRVRNPNEINNTPQSPASSSTMSGTTISDTNPAYNNNENKDEEEEESPEPPMSSLLSLLSAPEYIPSISDDPKQDEKEDIISIVGDRIVIIPSISSLKTDLIQSEYCFHSKKNLKNSGLKRSRTTFQH